MLLLVVDVQQCAIENMKRYEEIYYTIISLWIILQFYQLDTSLMSNQWQSVEKWYIIHHLFIGYPTIATKEGILLYSYMFSYENIDHQLQDRYQKVCRCGWMSDGIELQGKGVHINIEDKVRLYMQVIHIRIKQKINGVTL